MSWDNFAIAIEFSVTAEFLLSMFLDWVEGILTVLPWFSFPVKIKVRYVSLF